MGVLQTMQRMCKQDAVYWGNPSNDGFGGKTFDPPVDIKVMWIHKTALLSNNPKGETILAEGVVYVLQDVDEMGYLMPGTLNDINSADYNRPKNIDGAREIKMFSRVPSLNAPTEFVRKAYMGHKL